MTEKEEFILERYELAAERIREIAQDPEAGAYWNRTAAFVALCDDVISGAAKPGPELNMRLYEDILPEHYEESFANPDYALAQLGPETAPYLCTLYYELRSMIPNAFEGQREEMVIRMELFLEMFGSCRSEGERESVSERLRTILYWFFRDYAEQERSLRFAQIVAPVRDFAREIICGCDLQDLNYLYRFGEYISDNELQTAAYLNELPEEEVRLMADTFTEGYRKGFEMTGKDITIKKTVSIRYPLGFERMIRIAIDNFDKMGLQTSVYRAQPSIFFSAHTTGKNGYTGGNPNKQYDYDHKDDDALFLDADLLTRRLEAVRSAGEEYREQAKLFGGPAVIDTFGEVPFTPVEKNSAPHPDAKVLKMFSKQRVQSAVIQNEYIIGKERSFTIIAFPIPEIGPRYKEIFHATMELNTLDYELYQTIQQKLIAALDMADHVIVRGMNGNRTQLRIQLHPLENPKEETNFENCVADVNIPVGEVFTSPLLKGTCGTLHVSGVYLSGLYYKDLEIRFEDGRVTDYRCGNFEDPEAGRKYIEDNILFHHEGLPIGEFAIGTNTTAYRMARIFGIEDKLPILIAEKTGPHFALGDTCYSHEEEIVTRNPDGKRIIARSNEISEQYKTDPEKAYFGCHTDITIPYDELGELSAVTSDGVTLPIILNGRFTLPGTGELNRPLLEA